MAKRRGAQPPVSTDESALLSAIACDPEEDSPRLAYADWLDERGRPDRARFIRAQCRWERLPPTDPERPELERLANQLLHENAAQWSSELGIPANRIEYRRGFPEAVTIAPGEFARCAERMFAAAPIRRLRLRPPEQFPDGTHEEEMASGDAPLPAGWLNPALARPEFTYATELDFAGTAVTDQHLAAVLECPRTRPLTALSLKRTSHVTPSVAQLLASSPALNRLTTLDLGGCGRGRWGATQTRGLGPSEVRLLARSPNLRGVIALNLASNEVRNDGAIELAAAPWALTELDLSNTRISPAGATALAASRWFGGLEELHLGWNCVKDAGTESIARSESFPCLRVLDLRSNGIGHAGARSLLGSRLLGTIRALHLSRGRQLPWDDVFALRDAFGHRLRMDQ